jgi:cyclophilin family peptidyl-prolyl cis-trans isomerase
MQSEAEAARRQRLRRNIIRIVVILALVIGAAFAYSVLTGDDDADDVEVDTDDAADSDIDDSDIADTEIAEADDAEEAEAVTTTLAEPGEPAEPTCPDEDGSSPRTVTFAAPPPLCIDPSVTYIAEVQTSQGDFEITLDTDAAPQTVNNFVFLARWHFYDDVSFHRIIPGFVVQGGDPIGPELGMGGPGYEMGDSEDFDGELPSAEPYYPRLSVAMANGGGDPQTNGSQFFIVTGPQGEALPNDYTRFGQVTAGEDVVADIEATGTSTGDPSEPTVIESITISAAS